MHSVGVGNRALRQSSNAATCVECGAVGGPRMVGWLAYQVEDLEAGKPPTLGFYCPTCAERELGYRAG